MSFLKSFTINGTEFVSKESSDILLPKTNPNDPDVSVADKLVELESLIKSDGGGGGITLLENPLALCTPDFSYNRGYFSGYLYGSSSYGIYLSNPNSLSCPYAYAYDKEYIYYALNINEASLMAKSGNNMSSAQNPKSIFIHYYLISVNSAVKSELDLNNFKISDQFGTIPDPLNVILYPLGHTAGVGGPSNTVADIYINRAKTIGGYANLQITLVFYPMNSSTFSLASNPKISYYGAFKLQRNIVDFADGKGDR